MFNGELCHPKSCYFTFDNSNDLLKAGPVWDFDWSAYTCNSALINKTNIYFDALFKTKDFNDELNSQLLKLNTSGVSDKISSLKNEIERGVYYDEIRWGTTFRNPVGNEKTNWIDYVEYLEECINARLEAIKNINFETSYSLAN